MAKNLFLVCQIRSARLKFVKRYKSVTLDRGWMFFFFGGGGGGGGVEVEKWPAYQVIKKLQIILLGIITQKLSPYDWKSFSGLWRGI